MLAQDLALFFAGSVRRALGFVERNVEKNRKRDCRKFWVWEPDLIDAVFKKKWLKTFVEAGKRV